MNYNKNSFHSGMRVFKLLNPMTSISTQKKRQHICKGRVEQQKSGNDELLEILVS